MCFVKKLVKNSKINLSAESGRGTSSSDPLSGRKLIADLESPSC